MKEKIPGGLASGKDPSSFDQKALADGSRVEMEHTKDQKVAREIAMDHLTEDPKYYEKLARMEKSDNVNAAIRSLLSKNPKPEDEEIHALAGKLGMEPDDLEEKIYEMLAKEIKKSGIDELDDYIEKSHKYIERTGTPGNYKYTYEDSSGAKITVPSRGAEGSRVIYNGARGVVQETKGGITKVLFDGASSAESIKTERLSPLTKEVESDFSKPAAKGPIQQVATELSRRAGATVEQLKSALGAATDGAGYSKEKLKGIEEHAYSLRDKEPNAKRVVDAARIVLAEREKAKGKTPKARSLGQAAVYGVEGKQHYSLATESKTYEEKLKHVKAALASYQSGIKEANKWEGKDAEVEAHRLQNEHNYIAGIRHQLEQKITSESEAKRKLATFEDSFKIPGTNFHVDITPDPQFQDMSRYSHKMLSIKNKDGETQATMSIVFEDGKGMITELVQNRGDEQKTSVPPAAYPIIKQGLMDGIGKKFVDEEKNTRPSTQKLADLISAYRSGGVDEAKLTRVMVDLGMNNEDTKREIEHLGYEIENADPQKPSSGVVRFNRSQRSNKKAEKSMTAQAIDDLDSYLEKSGPYIGPRGGKWADANHTIPWKESVGRTPTDTKKFAVGQTLEIEVCRGSVSDDDGIISGGQWVTERAVVEEDLGGTSIRLRTAAGGTMVTSSTPGAAARSGFPIRAARVIDDEPGDTDTLRDSIEALARDEKDLERNKANLAKLQSGGKVENLTIEGAKQNISGLQAVIANKKKLLGKSSFTDAIDDLNGYLEKSEGEGSRGGNVIGHTSSGKPIYAVEQSKHPTPGWGEAIHAKTEKGHEDKSPSLIEHGGKHWVKAGHNSDTGAVSYHEHQPNRHIIDKKQGIAHNAAVSQLPDGQRVVELHGQPKHSMRPGNLPKEINDPHHGKLTYRGHDSDKLTTMYNVGSKKMEKAMSTKSFDALADLVKANDETLEKAGTPKNDKERLITHFGKEKAEALLKEKGDDAYKTLPEKGNGLKKSGIPTGQPTKLPEGTEAGAGFPCCGGPLSGVGKSAGSENPANPDKDQDANGNPKGVPSPVNKDWSMEEDARRVFGGGVMKSTGSLEKDRAVAASRLRKGQGDIHPFKMSVVHGNAEERIAQLSKGGANELNPKNAVIHRDVMCKSCSKAHSAMLTSCPNCGEGAVGREMLTKSNPGVILDNPKGAPILRPHPAPKDILIKR